MSVRELGNSLGNPLGRQRGAVVVVSSDTTSTSVYSNELTSCGTIDNLTQVSSDARLFFEQSLALSYTTPTTMYQTVFSAATIEAVDPSNKYKLIVFKEDSILPCVESTSYTAATSNVATHTLSVPAFTVTDNLNIFTYCGSTTAISNGRLFALTSNRSLSKILAVTLVATNITAPCSGNTVDGVFFITYWVDSGTTAQHSVIVSRNNGLTFNRYTYLTPGYANSSNAPYKCVSGNTLYPTLGYLGDSGLFGYFHSINLLDMSARKHSFQLYTTNLGVSAENRWVYGTPSSAGGIYTATIANQLTFPPARGVVEIGHLAEDGTYTRLAGVINYRLNANTCINSIFTETKDYVVFAFKDGSGVASPIFVTVYKTGGLHSITSNGFLFGSTSFTTVAHAVVPDTNKLIVSAGATSTAKYFGTYDLDNISAPRNTYQSAGAYSAIAKDALNGININPVDLSLLSDYSTYFAPTDNPLVISTFTSLAIPTSNVAAVVDCTTDFNISEASRTDDIQVKGNYIYMNGVPVLTNTGVTNV